MLVIKRDMVAERNAGGCVADESCRTWLFC
jgi:hypothetical protein